MILDPQFHGWKTITAQGLWGEISFFQKKLSVFYIIIWLIEGTVICYALISPSVAAESGSFAYLHKALFRGFAPCRQRSFLSIMIATAQTIVFSSLSFFLDTEGCRFGEGGGNTYTCFRWEANADRIKQSWIGRNLFLHQVLKIFDNYFASCVRVRIVTKQVLSFFLKTQANVHKYW